jgi:hypothetical protein
VKRRNEARRLQKEAEQAQREAAEQEFRARALLERAEQQQKLQNKQRKIHEQKLGMGTAVRQDREVHKLALDMQREEATFEAQSRAERVKATACHASRARARSEGAKQEIAKSAVRERLLREEDERRARLVEIERMEQEEAELLSRLQHSKERHRVAYLQLEDALRDAGNAPSTGLTPSASLRPSSSTGSDFEAARLMLNYQHCGQSTSSSSNAVVTSRSGNYLPPLSTHSNIAARPPRPRGLPTAASSSSSDARRSNSVRRQSPTPDQSLFGTDSIQEKDSVRALSSCSTASGTDNGQTGMGYSGQSTPCSASGPSQISYTTVDGLHLEIPEEEDLDLAALLNGKPSRLA